MDIECSAHRVLECLKQDSGIPTYPGIRAFLPSLQDGALQPAYAGIIGAHVCQLIASMSQGASS
jgi:hypothetical protein